MADESQRVRVTIRDSGIWAVAWFMLLAASCVGSDIRRGASDIAKALKERPACQPAGQQP
jgi:hypothetical protein